MPNLETMTKFDNAALGRLQESINRYYDYVEANDTPGRRNVATGKANVDLQRAIRELHTQAAVIGADGEKLTAGEKTLLKDLIAKDQDYMDGFIKDLPDLTRDQALFRCDLYVSTIGNTANEIALVDLPTLPIRPRSMSLKCTWHCKCTVDVRRVGQGSWDVYWLMDPEAEHCEDCLALSEQWSPLQIRNGKILEGKQLTARQLRILKAALSVALTKKRAA